MITRQEDFSIPRNALLNITAGSILGPFHPARIGGHVPAQGADLSAATDNVLIVIDGDTVNNAWVDVMINQNERGQRGVTT